MSSTKLLFQLWIICYFYVHARHAMSFDLQLPDIRLFKSCKIDKIYQFGASFSDTGNRVVEDPTIAPSRLPYGESSFLGPTGRYSNGLLVIDYIALAAGIPLLNPYLKPDANFTHGVNFAVAGATALSFKNITRVIDIGAARVIVPGVFPLGCFPSYLRNFRSDDNSAYDGHQCLHEFNDFIAFHNEYLQQTLMALQEENPHTTIVYVDYYNAFLWLLYNAPQLGFDAASALKGCCGNTGDSSDGCGSSNVRVCSNPDQYISWDGVHFTQRAHSVLATLAVADLIPKLNCAGQVDDY